MNEVNEQAQQEQMDNKQGNAAVTAAPAKAPGMSVEDLSKRDFILLVDMSGSMSTKDTPTGQTRWDYAKEGAEALARECEKYDQDGITVGVFNGKWMIHENIKAGSEDLHNIFTHNQPGGNTNTAGVLDAVLAPYLLARPNAKPLTIICVTDGEPTSQQDVVDVIVNATKKIEDDSEIGISFIQVGKDGNARAFLQMLDDDLVKKHGAKFDIVDTKTDEDMNDIPLTEILIQAVTD